MTAEVTIELVLSITAMTCFVVGTVANIALLYRVTVSIIVSRASRRYGFTSVKELPHSNSTRAFIMSLSVVDLIGLMIIPMNELQAKHGELFSFFACQLIYAIDWASKFFVAMLLTGLTIHRYTSVCLSRRAETNLAKYSVIPVLIIIWSFVIVLATIPIFVVSTDGFPLNRNATITETNNSDTCLLEQPQFPRCMLDFPDKTWTLAMTLAAVSLTCLLPGSLTIVFSRLLLQFLHEKGQIRDTVLTTKSQRLFGWKFHRNSRRHSLGIAFSNLVTIIFWYFICFIPYWTLSIIATSFLPMAEPSPYVTALIVVCYIANLGPYIHASINPFLCLCMNKNLWYQSTSSQSTTTTTTPQSPAIYQGPTSTGIYRGNSDHEQSEDESLL